MKQTLLVALVALLFQAPPTQQPPKPPTVTDAVVEITVRDSATKEPIPGARITFNHFQSPPPNIVTYVNADESGHAIFRNQTDGSYAITAQRDGYIGPASGVIIASQ